VRGKKLLPEEEQTGLSQNLMREVSTHHCLMVTTKKCHHKGTNHGGAGQLGLGEHKVFLKREEDKRTYGGARLREKDSDPISKGQESKGKSQIGGITQTRLHSNGRGAKPLRQSDWELSSPSVIGTHH